MNEFKSLTDEQVEEMYYRASRAIRGMSPLMATNDRLYLEQRKSKLRQEWLKRTLGQ